jgi:hypothetical protein
MNRPVSPRRRRGQRGIEAIEFGLFAMMVTPALVWMFTTGMNFVRFDKANDVARATALMYVKGTDLTLIGSQEIIERLGNGLNLVVDNGATPPNQVLSNSLGSGLLVVSRVQYVGPNTCSSCANTNKFVFMHRVYIGNTSLQIDGTTQQSALGNPDSSIWSSTTGLVSSPYTNTGAQVASSFASLWGSPGVADGQVIYVVEGFFAGSFGSGQFQGNGIYVRLFM